MQGYELLKAIEKEKQARPNSVFIKWWRKEEDYIDFELLAGFIEKVKNDGTNIEGFELIDQDEMWRTVEARCKGRASKVQREGRWVVIWTPPEHAELEERLPEYPYTPESLLKILDIETNYNYVD